jgi:hypothetical protein
MKELVRQLKENSFTIEVIDSGLDQQPEIFHFIGLGPE